MKWAAQPAQFAVHVSPGPNAVITISGELDIASAPVFEAAVRELEFRSLESAVLNLEPLDFIDAQGLRTVLSLHAACLAASVPLLIRAGPLRVHRLFELTGTDVVLPFSGR
jgi:anti-sigma B factor antagonist